jgi:hypothetical protein
VYDFVMDQNQGLPRIINFLNGWASELDQFENLLVVRYEDLRSDPEAELVRLMAFLGEDVDPKMVKDTVEFASVENMRKMESQNYFWRSGSRVQARDTSDPNTYKVRKAKVGGYRDYFDDEQIAVIDAMVNERLSPAFGYTDREQQPEAEVEAGSAAR